MMKNILVVACVAVAVLGATTCNKLLNCQTCLDETHCKDCPTGYYLDNNQVCRYNCTEAYGARCPQCTPDKCLCENGKVWNSTAKHCSEVKTCTDSSPAACQYCGLGYDLIDVTGKCGTCASVFGTGCKSCDPAKCLTVEDGYKLCGAIAKSTNDTCPTGCDATIPGCSECSGTVCTKCNDKAELDGGFCKFKFETCNRTKKIIYKNGVFTCGTCQDFDENCVGTRCSGSGCTMCRTGFAVTSKGGCMNCSSTYANCSLCQEGGCSKCSSSVMILTPNGCFNQNPYVPPKNSNGGMIAGIVIGCLVLIAIIVLAVYCIVIAVSKHGAVDLSIYEDDLQFKSVSVL